MGSAQSGAALKAAFAPVAGHGELLQMPLRWLGRGCPHTHSSGLQLVWVVIVLEMQQ